MNTKKIGAIGSAAIYTFGAFFVQGINFITIPVFAKFMSPNDFGLYSSYESWVAVVTVLLGLQTVASVINAFSDYGENGIVNYVRSVTSIGWLTFIIIFLLLFLFHKSLEALFELDFFELFLGIIQCLFAYFLVMLLNRLRVTNEPLLYLYFSSANTLLSVLLGLLFINTKFFSGSFARILGSTLAATVVGVIALFYIYENKFEIHFEHIKYALVLSFPLVFHALSGIVLGKTDQIMLLKMTSASEMGIYSYGNKLGHVIYILYTAINQAFIPWYYLQKKKKNSSAITTLVTIYSCLFGLFCSSFLLMLPDLITLVSPNTYLGAIYITPIIVVAFYFNFLYIFPSTHEFYYKKTGFIALGTVFSAVINVLLNLLLIEKFGGVGAAIATCFSTIALLLFHLFIAIKVVGNYEIPLFFFIKNGMYVTLLLGVYFLSVEQFKLRFFLSIILLIVFCLVVHNNYKKVRQIT